MARCPRPGCGHPIHRRPFVKGVVCLGCNPCDFRDRSFTFGAVGDEGCVSPRDTPGARLTTEQIARFHALQAEALNIAVRYRIRDMSPDDVENEAYAHLMGCLVDPVEVFPGPIQPTEADTMQSVDRHLNKLKQAARRRTKKHATDDVDAVGDLGIGSTDVRNRNLGLLAGRATDTPQLASIAEFWDDARRLLTPREYDVTHWTYTTEAKDTEIADALGIEVKAVYNARAKAKCKLQTIESKYFE